MFRVVNLIRQFRSFSVGFLTYFSVPYSRLRPGDGSGVGIQLAGRAVDSGRVRPPAAWHTPSGGALVALTAHRWQQRLSAWLPTKLSTLLLRRTKPDGVSWLDALDAA